MNEQYTRAPHRRSTGPVGTSPNAALMIDFDNVTMAIRSNLGQELRNFLNSDIVRGKVSVQRAYADWRRYPQYIVPLSEASIDLIFAPAYGSSKKNATDIRLAIDALELVFTRPEIGTFILLSGDSDFSSLVLKLKEYGKYVIGVGLQESTSDLLVQNCDEYYSYTSLSGLTSASELKTDKHDPWELVEVAVKKMADRDDVMRSDRLKQVMLEIDQGFDEKDYGFSKFNRFLAEASSRGLLNLRKIENGQYEVGPADGRGGSSSSSSSSSSSRSRESGGEGRGRRGGRGGRGRGRSSSREERREPEPTREPPAPVEAASLRDAYRMLREVTGSLSEDGEPVRDSEIKRALLERDEHFDEAALGFSKFSRFLRQAYDEGVVDLITDDDGNYHVSVIEEEGGGRSGDRESRKERAPSGRGGEREASGRGDGGGRSPAERQGGRPERGEPEAEEEPGRGSSVARDAAASMAESRRESAGRGEREAGETGGAEETVAEERSEAAEEAEEAHRPSGGRRRGGLGRFRRGSRGGGHEPTAGSSVLPGPVDAGGAPDEAGQGDEGADEGPGSRPSPRGEHESTDSGRRGVGLGRRRGRRGAADDVASPESQGRAERDESAASAGDRSGSDAGSDGRTADSGDVVEHMVKNYAGVGRKTAEALVDAFGERVYSVIDEDPDRLTRVLPEHRAQAVIEAREAEREGPAPGGA